MGCRDDRSCGIQRALSVDVSFCTGPELSYLRLNCLVTLMRRRLAVVPDVSFFLVTMDKNYCQQQRNNGGQILRILGII